MGMPLPLTPFHGFGHRDNCMQIRRPFVLLLEWVEIAQALAILLAENALIALHWLANPLGLFEHVQRQPSGG